MTPARRLSIEALGNTLACEIDEPFPGAPVRAISLHGGGPLGKEGTSYLAPVFLARGEALARLDFSGQGESSGSIPESSLKGRFEEALKAMDALGMVGDATVIGTSMGGYVATRLAATGRVSRLVLFCPAAYTPRAWGVSFGGGFTEIIRSPLSYLESDVPSLLASFRGPSFLCLPSDDEVVPAEVTRSYRENLARSGPVSVYTVGGCPHPVHRWSDGKPAVRDGIVSALSDFLDGAKRDGNKKEE